MATTPTYQLPYPAATDTPDVPRDMQALALAVENILKGKAPSDYDSGWISTLAHFVPSVTDGGGVTTATNWTISSLMYRKLGALVEISVSAVYVGATPINPGTTGDIGNSPIGTFKPLGQPIAAAWLPKTGCGMTSTAAGRVAMATMYTAAPNSGVVKMTSVGGSAPIPAQTAFSLTGVYLVQ